MTAKQMDGGAFQHLGLSDGGEQKQGGATVILYTKAVDDTVFHGLSCQIPLNQFGAVLYFVGYSTFAKSELPRTLLGAQERRGNAAR